MALLRYQARISGTEDSGADAAAMTCWRTDCYERRDALASGLVSGHGDQA